MWTSKALVTLGGEHTCSTGDLQFSLDGTLIAGNGIQTSAYVWDAKTGAEKVVLTDKTQDIRSVTLSPDGATLAELEYSDQRIQLWDVKTGKLKETIKSRVGLYDVLIYRPEGLRLLTSDDKGHMKLVDVRTQAILLIFDQGIRFNVRSAHLTPDGQQLYADDSAGDMALWNLQNGFVVTKYQGYKTFVEDTAFSPDGKRLITLGYDQAIYLWETNTGKQLTTLNPYSGFQDN